MIKNHLIQPEESGKYQEPLKRTNKNNNQKMRVEIYLLT